jgi:glycine oxidase
MATPAPSPDVAIVGGGIIGCAIAYFLAADHGLRPAVIERDTIAVHASGTAAGELSPVGRVAPADDMVRFGIEGLTVHRAMASILIEASSIDYLLTDTPLLRPAFTSAEAETLRQQYAALTGMGMKPSWVDAPELPALNPWLPRKTLCALLTQEAQLETHPFATALARAAKRRGVAFHTGEVTGLLTERGRVDGVLIGGEPLSAQAVVLATGPWAGEAGAWLGYDIPVRPLKGQIVYLEPPGSMPEHAIFHLKGFVLPKPSGSLMVGTTEEEAGFDSEPTQMGQAVIMEAIASIAPTLTTARVQKTTACLRPLSEDGLPIIGPAPDWEGLYLATGHGHKGILLSLATGKYLAQLMVNGHSDYPLDAFSPQRLAMAR